MMTAAKKLADMISTSLELEYRTWRYVDSGEAYNFAVDNLKNFIVLFPEISFDYSNKIKFKGLTIVFTKKHYNNQFNYITIYSNE